METSTEEIETQEKNKKKNSKEKGKIENDCADLCAYCMDKLECPHCPFFNVLTDFLISHFLASLPGPSNYQTAFEAIHKAKNAGTNVNRYVKSTSLERSKPLLLTQSLSKRVEAF